MNTNAKPFGMRDKIGYMFGDLANDMTFILQSMFLMVFYTEVWGINPTTVGNLFLAARFVDAITDVTMGRIVDVSKQTSEGKFKPWIRRIAIPVTLASFMMYQTGLQDMSMTFKIVYMYITYLLWGSFAYTAINIPYGSMASAITSDPDHRASLSTFRTIGATIAQLAIGAAVPLLIFENNVVKTDATFTILAGVFSILGLVFYFFCYRMTTERVEIPSDPDSSLMGTLRTFGKVLKSRSLWGIIFSALFLIFAQLGIGQMNNYLFANYFENADMLATVNIIYPLAVLFLAAPIAPSLAKALGKREVGILGVLIGSAAFGILYFMHTESIWTYIVISTIGYIGFGVFNAIIWAIITDVIDDIEVQTHTRDDGTVYAFYSFARKIGQAFAGASAGWVLGFIGYQSGAETQAADVINNIYSAATSIPAIAFLLSGLSLLIIYPLSKKRVENNSAILAERRG
ncbi:MULTISPECIES: MFS transporter [Aerococcus]|nr:MULTISPECIES: glycoside-pentoside-hexuronide (GPH):cation symporter [Aerococcus]MDK6369617.1 glycoside-pentoside-hexuronide (GPH):cation symporter [Aerococcus sp. UMB9870]MDK6680122.1 glycoside-pentoside-hexuronide (GPH):cation symporter [Aerococcus sp. UMB8608]MDK6686283.1 glycoside-pentoside-hexuronide (GPH):cation symporter [Aerococcus sp. UMB8623]MDK6940203.1 glycoside-pentoside-hexuronide (GPH):cation symporter [Aerococcus sp. UMB8487]OFK17653.1 MFS transporter [Aerococcus sp. HMSC072A